MNTTIKTTADGSSTLYVPELNEHYHSINGAVQESMHVFIKNGLQYISVAELKILEVGFGTGLNALLTLISAKRNKRSVYYHAIEINPLAWEEVKELQYPTFLGNSGNCDQLFERMHQVAWGADNLIDTGFCLHKTKSSIAEINPSDTYDLVYYDAFAPSVQPEMWTEEILQKMFNCVSTGGILVTYCAKGEVRRQMQRIGFVVERLEGPPGKHEMLRANKPAF